MIQRLLIGTLLLTACGEWDENAPTPYENIGRAFAECERARIKNLADRYNLKGAFAWCGSNNFAHFTWNPEGWLLYFDLTHTANLLNAETKGMSTIPVDPPLGQPAWVTPTRLAIPVKPATNDPRRRERVALFDPAQSSIAYKLISDYTKLTDLNRGDDANTLVLLATKGEVQGAYQLDLSTGKVTAPYDWLPPKVDTLTYTAKQHALVVGVGDTVTLYDSRSGDVRGRWSPATRGTVSPNGHFIALEHEGEEKSVFYDPSWESLPERAKKRKMQEAEELEEQLPDWYPSKVKLPTFSFVDLRDHPDQRWELLGIYGTRFQWYEAEDYYGSFMLWGFEGRQYNRNVMLADLRIPLFQTTKGADTDKIRQMPKAATNQVEAPPTPTPSEGAEADEKSDGAEAEKAP